MFPLAKKCVCLSITPTFTHYPKLSFFKVAAFPTGHGDLDVLTHNPANAIVCSGDTSGMVCMWSPNSKKPLVEMFAHRGPVHGVAVDQRGTYMATTGLDNKMRLWDLRTYKELYSYSGQRYGFSNLTFSQRNCLAIGSGPTVQVPSDI